MLMVLSSTEAKKIIAGKRLVGRARLWLSSCAVSFAGIMPATSDIRETLHVLGYV